MIQFMKIQIQVLETKLDLNKISKIKMHELILNGSEYLPYSTFIAMKKVYLSYILFSLEMSVF